MFPTENIPAKDLTPGRVLVYVFNIHETVTGVWNTGDFVHVTTADGRTRNYAPDALVCVGARYGD